MLLVGNGSSPHVWVEIMYPESETRHRLVCSLDSIYGLDGGQNMFFLSLLGKFWIFFTTSKKVLDLVSNISKFFYLVVSNISKFIYFYSFTLLNNVIHKIPSFNINFIFQWLLYLHGTSSYEGVFWEYT